MRNKLGGRPKLPALDFQIVRSYRLPRNTWLDFKSWCEEKDLKVSDVVRGSIKLIMNENNIPLLLQNDQTRNLAENLLNELREEEK